MISLDKNGALAAAGIHTAFRCHGQGGADIVTVLQINAESHISEIAEPLFVGAHIIIMI